MNRKTVWLLAWIAIAAILVVVVLLFVAHRRPKEPAPVTIEMRLPWGRDNGSEYFEGEAKLFEETYPWITVEFVTTPLGDLNRAWQERWPDGAPDLAVVSTDIGADWLLPDSTPFPWTGTLWALYANAEILGRLGEWSAGVPAAWQSGSVTVDDLEALFDAILELGIAPVSVGAKYVWPFAAWLQHLSLALDETSVPISENDVANDAATQAALNRWQRWVSEGWIVGDWKSKDWPESARDVASGTSAIALLSASLATSFPPESRGNILVVPFPNGARDAWTVGSLWYLADREAQ